MDHSGDGTLFHCQCNESQSNDEHHCPISDLGYHEQSIVGRHSCSRAATRRSWQSRRQYTVHDTRTDQERHHKYKYHHVAQATGDHHTNREATVASATTATAANIAATMHRCATAATATTIDTSGVHQNRHLTAGGQDVAARCHAIWLHQYFDGS